MCPSGKIPHATREAAEEHQKKLVYKNFLDGKPELSKGLNVYPCSYTECGAFHVGHNDTTVPLVYHYTVGDRVQDILAAGELRPRKDRSTLHDQRAAILEPKPVLWFSRHPEWEHSVMKAQTRPKGCTFPAGRAANEIAGRGLFRWAAYPSVAKLRWSDYLTLNDIHILHRDAMAQRGNPVDWLVTDAPVPLSECRGLEVYAHGRWRDVDMVSIEEFDRYLEGRVEAYNEAWERVIQKMLFPDPDGKILLTDEAEEIVYEDFTLECDVQEWVKQERLRHPDRVRQFKAVFAKKAILDKKHRKKRKRRR